MLYNFLHSRTAIYAPLLLPLSGKELYLTYKLFGNPTGAMGKVLVLMSHKKHLAIITQEEPYTPHKVVSIRRNACQA